MLRRRDDRFVGAARGARHFVGALLALGCASRVAGGGGDAAADTAVDASAEAAVDGAADGAVDAAVDGAAGAAPFACGSLQCRADQICVERSTCTSTADGGCPDGAVFVPQHACFHPSTYRCVDAAPGCDAANGAALCECVGEGGVSSSARCSTADGRAGEVAGCF